MISEKVKEILKFCSEGKDCYDGCPYKHDTHCVMKISKQALTLINKLEKENARLNKVVKHNQELIEDGKLISSEQLKQFAERLKEQIKAIAKWYDDHADKTYNGIREKDIDETLKEFI